MLKDCQVNLNFEAVAMLDDIFAIAIRYESNGIFKVNMETGDCYYMGMIPNEKITSQRLYTKAVRLGEKIYFIPAAASEIAVYEIDNHNIYKIPYKKVEKDREGYKKNSNFNGCASYGRYLFMIPCTYPEVVRIDTADDTLSYYGNWNFDGEYKFRKAAEICGSKFYVANTLDSNVLEFDMEKCDGTIKTIGEGKCGYWDIYKSDDAFWLSPLDNTPVIKWYADQDRYIEIGCYPDNFIGGHLNFTKIYEYNNYIYLIPGLANMGIRISKKNNIIERTDVRELQNVKENLMLFEINNKIYMRLNDGNNISNLVLDTQSNTIQKIFFRVIKGNDKFKNEYKKGMIEEKGILKEDMVVGLYDFINDI